MGCMPGIRVWIFWSLASWRFCAWGWTFWSLASWRFCAWWFFKPNWGVWNMTGVFETCVVGETIEWHWWNYTSCLWSDSSRQWQCLHRTSHHKKISWRDHNGFFACSTVKRLWNDFRGSSEHISQIDTWKTWFGQLWAWDNKLHGFSASWDFCQTSESFSLLNYDAWQDIWNYICMFTGGYLQHHLM